MNEYIVYDLINPIKPVQVFIGNIDQITDYLKISEVYARNCISLQTKVKRRYIITKKEEGK